MPLTRLEVCPEILALCGVQEAHTSLGFLLPLWNLLLSPHHIPLFFSASRVDGHWFLVLKWYLILSLH